MMAVKEYRLIDANALDIPNYGGLVHHDPFIEGFRQGRIDAINEVKALAPVVDAKPVVHGKWLDVFTGLNFFAATCSVCHKRSDLPPIAVAKYCPRCGAKNGR